MSTDKMWKGTSKRVPLILSAVLANGANTTFQITPQYPFRAEHVIVDPTTAATLTIQPLTVGPNVQVAGGSNVAPMGGAMFPPTQTDCMRIGCDIAMEGNQLTLVATTTLTSTSATYNIWINGTVAREMTSTEKVAHNANVTAGIAPAGNFAAGIAPAGSFTGARS